MTDFRGCKIPLLFTLGRGKELYSGRQNSGIGSDKAQRSNRFGLAIKPGLFLQFSTGRCRRDLLRIDEATRDLPRVSPDGMPVNPKQADLSFKHR